VQEAGPSVAIVPMTRERAWVWQAVQQEASSVPAASKET